MKNIVLSMVVVITLVAAGVGGTFAGFVDTEESKGNFIQAGISDLLVNGKNDPIGPKITFVHAAPCKSVDYYIDLFNWGVCQGGWVWLHIKNVDSREAGTKLHMGTEYVYDGVAPAVGDIPMGYRPAVGDEPVGPGVWSSEPEKISEVGDGVVGQIYIDPANPMVMGEDYASGISEHLDVHIEVCDDGADGTLDNPDDDGDGTISAAERAAHDWTVIAADKLVNLECIKWYLGFLPTQKYAWIHMDLHLQQIEDPMFPGDPQLIWWPGNALQGDIATFDMLFELITDP